MSNAAELEAKLAQLKARVAELEAVQKCESEGPLAHLLPNFNWHALVANAPMMVTIFDSTGRLLYLNRAAPGFEVDQVVGTSVYEWMPADWHAPFREAIAKVFRTGEMVYCEGFDSVANRHWGNHLGPIKQGDRVVAVSDISEDITERVKSATQLAENEARLRIITESMPILCWTIDPEMRITSSRGAALVELGLKPEQVVGLTLQQYYGSEQAAAASLETHRRALEGKTTIDFGAWAGRHYQSTIAPLRDGQGKIFGAIGVAMDITERVRQEEHIRASRDELEQRVQERTNALNAANQSLRRERVVLQRLVDLHERDRQITAYEIHDGIVQDMSAALMFLEVAGNSFDSEENHATRSFKQGLQVLRSSIREARRIMNGISPDVLEQFGPIEAVAAQIQEKRELSGIEIEFQHEVQFDRLAPAIELAMFRIVQESLNNLWKHSGSRRAQVVIQQIAERVQITVRDWGHGFDITKIAPKRYGLLGIRERARLLGGEATIVSQAGEGTTITVVLPLTDLILQQNQADDAPTS